MLILSYFLLFIASLQARLFVLGDLEGDYENTVAALKMAKLIDANQQWIADKDDYLIQMGNIYGYGPDGYAIQMLFARLQPHVIRLLGSHEVQFMTGKENNRHQKDMTLPMNVISGLNQVKLIHEQLETVFAHSGVSLKYAAADPEALNRRFQNMIEKSYNEPDVLVALKDPSNPVFYNLFQNPENVCETVDAVLDMIDMKRMVVGAYLSNQPKISSICQGKLILTHSGFSRYRPSKTVKLDSMNFLVIEDDGTFWGLNRQGHYAIEDYSDFLPKQEPKKIVTAVEVPKIEKLQITEHSKPPLPKKLPSFHSKKERQPEPEKFSDDKFEYNSDTRIVAVGDVHGDYENLLEIFLQAKVTDLEENWIAEPNTVVVVTGDFIDRGPETFKIFSFFKKIKKDAPQHGSKVVILLGNHEIMNMANFYDSVSKEEISRYPTGLFTYLRQKEFSENGFYGSFLRQLPIVAQFGPSIFVHAGISTEWSSKSVDELNRLAKESLDKIKINPLSIYESTVLDYEGPTWYRGFSMDPENIACGQLEKALSDLNAEHMIVGHTITKTRMIETRCNGQLIMIDIQISKFSLGGNHLGFLEIKNGVYKAVYPTHEKILMSSS